MFQDSEFFPTPREVIEKMLEPYKSERAELRGYKYYEIAKKTILEPSAGKGDILDYITGNYVLSTEEKYGNDYHTKTRDSTKKDKIYCCEQDPNLRHILQDKGYRVISDDFLEYNGDYYFDLILMNPPFSNGDEHLLKAWDILHEGEIVCLLNSETIKNPHTQKRKHLAKIIQDNGSVEHLGAVFNDAERKTNVMVSMVRLKKAKSADRFDFQFEGMNKERSFHIDESTLNDAPALKDIIGNMLIQYDKIKEGFVEYMKIAAQLNHYGSPLVYVDPHGKEAGFNIFSLAQESYSSGTTKKESFNIFCDGMKGNMWKIIFSNLNNITSFNMEKFMTHSIRKNFSEFAVKQGHMDFTRENVWNVITMLHDNKEAILERAIVEVFDVFTSYYKENRAYQEGWKTNDKWKVNRKIILPRAVRYGEYSTGPNLKEYGDNFKLHYESHSQYSDIDKALDYICGGRKTISIAGGREIKEPGLYDSLEAAFKKIGNVKTGDKFDNTGTSAYFDWKFWKKGTLHIEFKDKKLWEEFNLRACAGKMWLPENEMKDYEARKQKKSQPQPKPEPVLQLEAVNEEFEFVDI